MLNICMFVQFLKLRKLTLKLSIKCKSFELWTKTSGKNKFSPNFMSHFPRKYTFRSTSKEIKLTSLHLLHCFKHSLWSCIGRTLSYFFRDKTIICFKSFKFHIPCSILSYDIHRILWLAKDLLRNDYIQYLQSSSWFYKEAL